MPVGSISIDILNADDRFHGSEAAESVSAWSFSACDPPERDSIEPRSGRLGSEGRRARIGALPAWRPRIASGRAASRCARRMNSTVSEKRQVALLRPRFEPFVRTSELRFIRNSTAGPLSTVTRRGPGGPRRRRTTRVAHDIHSNDYRTGWTLTTLRVDSYPGIEDSSRPCARSARPARDRLTAGRTGREPPLRAPRGRSRRRARRHRPGAGLGRDGATGSRSRTRPPGRRR